MTDTPQDIAQHLWHAGVAAVGGYSAVDRALQDKPISKPNMILAVGKAAPAMAEAACAHFPGVPTLVVTKDGHGQGLPDTIDLIEAAHPMPDARSLQAGRALRQRVQQMPPDGQLLLLVSGGASSLAEDLVQGCTLEDLKALNARLLATGMDIGAMNAERRKISQVKGGGLLAAFAGAQATTLAISDVEGDSLDVIGSGIGAAPKTPAFRHDARIIASNAHARAAAEARAPLPVLCNEECLYDDVRALAAQLGPRLRNLDTGVMILGGEPTVVLPEHPGNGGRNQQLALELAREIRNEHGLVVLVAGTDGTDGPTNAAGGIVDGQTWAAGGAAALDAADAGRFLAERGALFTTGPTGTNVMDLIIAIRR